MSAREILATTYIDGHNRPIGHLHAKAIEVALTAAGFSIVHKDEIHAPSVEPTPTNQANTKETTMNTVVRAYLVTVASEASRLQRLVMTPSASAACEAALEDVFVTERENWPTEDQASANPFWIESVSLVARNDAFNGSTGIITL